MDATISKTWSVAGIFYFEVKYRILIAQHSYTTYNNRLSIIILSDNNNFYQI